MKQFAKDIGVKLVIKNMDFDSLLVALETGKIDCIAGAMNITNERKKSVDFSDVEERHPKIHSYERLFLTC